MEQGSPGKIVFFAGGLFTLWLIVKNVERCCSRSHLISNSFTLLYTCYILPHYYCITFRTYDKARQRNVLILLDTLSLVGGGSSYFVICNAMAVVVSLLIFVPVSISFIRISQDKKQGGGDGWMDESSFFA